VAPFKRRRNGSRKPVSRYAKTIKEKLMLQNRKGFTLLELIVVIVVAGILAGIAIPSFNAVKTKAKESAAVQEAKAFAKEVTALAAFTLAEDAGDFTTAADADSAGSYADVTGLFTSTNGLTVAITISGDVATAADSVSA
jgi:type IV pilus assembly protein PilA